MIQASVPCTQPLTPIHHPQLSQPWGNSAAKGDLQTYCIHPPSKSETSQPSLNKHEGHSDITKVLFFKKNCNIGKVS